MTPQSPHLVALSGFLLAFSLSCAHSVSQTPAHPRPPLTPPTAEVRANSGQARVPTAQERAAITRLMRLAEHVRGLRFREQVPISIENAEAVMSYARQELRRDELEHSRTIYVALGMLPADLDVESLLISLLGEQVVGYYDARKGRLVVRDDIMAGLSTHDQDAQSLAAREVLLHELVHALQDQHLGLRVRLDEPRSSDAENAFRALVEGDAMLAVAGFAARQAGVPLSALIGDRERMRNLAVAITEAATASPLLSEAPAIVREPLLSAYRDGLVYAAHLYLTGGGFSALNAAYASPPSTMREILHPEGSSAAVVIPTLAVQDALDGAGYTFVTQDTLGELELHAYLSASLPANEALTAAEGWNGDLVQVYKRPDGRTAALWLLLGEQEQDAQELAQAALHAQLARCGNPCDDHHVTRRDRQVLIAHDMPAELFLNTASAVLDARLDQAKHAH